MNIVFAADQGYVPHLVTAISSLLKNNQVHINIYIINSSIDEATWLGIESLDTLGLCYFTDIKISDDDLTGLVLNHHFTKAVYYRLLIPEKIPASKVLYIDSDVVIKGSILDFYETNLEGYYLAAVDNPGFTRHLDLGMNPESKYFNSGVMLINLEMWRDSCVKDRVIDFVKQRPEVIHFVDQCGLNAVVNGKWCEVHPKYNMQAVFYELNEVDANEIFVPGSVNSAIQCPVIVHYTGTSKPWQMENKHPYKPLYWAYRNSTHYRSLVPDDFSFNNVLRWFIPPSVRKVLRKILNRGAQ